MKAVTKLRLRWGAALLAGAAALGAVALWFTPLPAALESGAIISTEFVDREGHPLRTLLAEEKRFARRCSLGEVAPEVIAATLSAEDRRFRWHPGVDPLALARAAGGLFRRGQPVSGASTITQQLIKLAAPGPRTLSRKAWQMWLALRLEQSWNKDRILGEYLNRLDYGNLQIGIASASRYYFGKPPSHLSPAEAAFLAGLPRAPSRLNPHANPAGARARQQWVLGRMAATGRLTVEETARARAEPLRLLSPQREFAAPHFVDLLLGRRGLLPPGGGLVRTTLDLGLNRYAERCLDEQLLRIADKHATGGATVVLDNRTGEVLALAGHGDYFAPGVGQINGAWSIRSPGSAVKPFTYLLALEAGVFPGTVVADVPTDFPTETGLYRPNNYNHRFYGPVSLRFALGNSLNVTAIRVLELGGGPEALYRKLNAFGLTTLDHPAEYYGLGLTLGNGEVRLLELANAFAALGRLGMYCPFRLLLHEADGQAEAARRVAGREEAYLLADLLSDNSARAASFGLDSFLAFDFPVACKTGTSSDYRDNWAMGYTPEFTVGVWVGNPDGSPMRGITGVTGAAPVLHDLFTYLHTHYGTGWFARPAPVREVRIEPLTGHAVSATQAGAVLEKCLREPVAAQAGEYDKDGRVVLSAEYAPWLASEQNTLGSLVTSAAAAGPLRILQPLPGTTYFLDPDLPRDAQWLPLRAEGGSSIEWSCPTLTTQAVDGRPRLALRGGRHRITAHDSVGGTTAETWIQVEEL